MHPIRPCSCTSWNLSWGRKTSLPGCMCITISKNTKIWRESKCPWTGVWSNKLWYIFSKETVAISHDATEEYCHSGLLIMLVCVFFMDLLSCKFTFTLIMYFRWEKRKLTKWYHRVVQIFVMQTVSTHIQTYTQEILLEC